MNASSFVATADFAPGAIKATFTVGPHVVANGLALAPMAGITDKPMRALCRQWGADYAVAEMVSAQPHLRGSRKSQQRSDHAGEASPVAVQLLGNDPSQMADAARHAVDQGAQVIDINMGCPAKKVCNAAAGSALLGDESRVARILDAVVGAVDVPVTLKFRTGLTPTTKNAIHIARIAETAGIALLTLHGRTRACAFTGHAEYDTIAEVKRSVRIPVLANGDIDTPQKAIAVLYHTGADGVMIGRAALGQPWLFRDIAHVLTHGCLPPALSLDEKLVVIHDHLDALYAFYGEAHGVRIARKHLGHYAHYLPNGDALRIAANAATDPATQRQALLAIASTTRADGSSAASLLSTLPASTTPIDPLFSKVA